MPQTRSYLLRLWSVRQTDEVHWMAMVENVREGKSRAFPDLQTLALFLESECQTVESTPIDPLLPDMASDFPQPRL
jgi:hypothetical protein